MVLSKLWALEAFIPALYKTKDLEGYDIWCPSYGFTNFALGVYENYPREANKRPSSSTTSFINPKNVLL